MDLPENSTYAKEVDKYKNLLRKSPTAYNPGATPTKKDVSSQLRMITAEKIAASKQDAILKARWYGDKVAGEEMPKKGEGLLSKGLHILGTPLYAVAGVVETALGKGTKKGLVENIKANVAERGTFGDIIRSYGTRNMFAMPLGFALDVTMDPVMWLSGGTALVPKLGLSLLKGGGLKGASAVARGSMAGTAKSLVGVAKYGAEKVGAKKAATSLSKTYGSLAEQVKNLNKVYGDLTGDTVEAAIKGSVKAPGSERIFNKAYNYLQQSDFGKGLIRLFNYSPSGAMAADKATSEGLRAKEALDLAATGGIRKTFKEGLEEVDNLLSGTAKKNIAKNSNDVAAGLKDQAAKLKAATNEIDNTLKTMTEVINDTSISNKLIGMTPEQRKKMASVFSYYKSWDKGVADLIVKSPTALNTLDALAIITGVFKSAKIGLNPAAYVNASVGNPIMAMMVGLNIANKKYIGELKNAVNIYTGDKKALQYTVDNPKWKSFIEKYPEIFQSRFSINPEVVTNTSKYVADRTADVRKVLSSSPEFKNLSEKQMSSIMFDAQKQVTKVYKDAFRAVHIEPGAVPTTYLSEEILRGSFQRALNTLKAMGQSKDRTLVNIAAGMYEKITTKSLDAYSKLDQIARLSTSMHLTKNGISGSEVRKMAKRTTLNLGEDIGKIGDDLYAFSPSKAIEISDEMYMNYLAMPQFVQNMRTLPIIGSPFISFSYGALYGVTKTAFYNPEFYNKVSFALQEISGEKSPLEKEALNSKYYEWMKKPEMVKSPFGDSPVYVNLGNMIPHYTMSLVSPSERDYESKYGKTLSGIIDKLPIFDDPSGQILLDYFILPTLLQDEIPVGSFGQRLYPDKATLLEKTRAIGTSLAEAYLPIYNAPVAGLAGLALPESALPYAPYKAKKIGFAAKGKSAQGLLTPSQNPTEKVLHGIRGLVGFPTYPVDLTAGKPTKTK